MTPDQRAAALRLADALEDVRPYDARPYLLAESAALLRELAFEDPTDPGHDVEVLREHVRHLERRVRELTAPPQRKPLTEADLDKAIRAEMGAWLEDDDDLPLYRQIGRAVEVAHGITGETK